MTKTLNYSALAAWLFVFTWLNVICSGEDFFVEAPPVRAVSDSTLGPVLADIESHMLAGHPYRTSDPATWGHETTHGINSRVRNSVRGNVNAFYVLENRAIFIGEPPLRISDVEPLVPQRFRGPVFQQYISREGRLAALRSMPKPSGVIVEDWDDEPLYIVDEWTAYTNGTAVAVDWSSRGWRVPREETVGRMLMFCCYATALLQAVERSSGYADREKLVWFISWNLGRCFDLYEQAKRYPNLSDPRHEQIVAAFMDEYVAEGV